MPTTPVPPATIESIPGEAYERPPKGRERNRRCGYISRHLRDDQPDYIATVYDARRGGSPLQHAKTDTLEQAQAWMAEQGLTRGASR